MVCTVQGETGIRKDEKLEKLPQYHHQGKFVKLHQVYSTKSHTTVASQSDYEQIVIKDGS